MPTSAGPNTKGEENLVFGYDLGDVSNSYKGEPTTNIVPSPENNSRFTTNNTWYTYNTAQYNGNTYFSIGTVGSVSNNEVTLSSVARTLYTYDVLRPQTSGGGVTAGTNYMVKKTGANSFTLHAYNSSQNGSQGYINPETGTFKVHDSVALDQRISINSTDFPTMWWGYPHLPNMCYVKEVISSGGPNDNSSFMRIHLTRPSGTDGGMAYGVYPSVTQGDTITVSFWARSSVNSNWSWSTYFNAGFSAPGFGISSTTEWQRFQYTWTASNTFNFYMYFWPGNPGFVPYHVDLADIQVEINKGHATPFTLSSRSATQGLLDLTGNSTIDLTNVSFDSNAQMTFDGTDDYISFGVTGGGLAGASQATMELVVKIDALKEGSGAYQQVFGFRDNSDFDFFFLVFESANNGLTEFRLRGSNGTVYDLNPNILSYIGDYVHIVFTVSPTGRAVYYNGTLATSGGGWDSSFGSSSTFDIGRYGIGNLWFLDGVLPVAKIYNRALTASEIKSNFNAIKSRFNI